MIGDAGRSALGSRGQGDGWVGGPIGGSVGGIRCKSWMRWGQEGGGKARSINVCETFDKTWVKYRI